MEDLNRGIPDSLVAAVDDLIEHYGLAAVHNEVRSRPGFCGNCGCPFKDGERSHVAGGMGYCVG